MMSHDDAELLLDENFIAMDESNPFDVEEEENDPYYGALKHKKKNDFNFTSLWRKPKMGRRKSRGIGRKQDASNEIEFDDISSSLMTRGKYVKDRESFGSVGSVPLSDFDEAKDMLPFLHFRSANSNTRTSFKERSVLNPKMVLTQASAKRREMKNQIKKDKSVVEKLEEEESRDIFKPIHNSNNDNTFDAFQILPKESPNKVKAEDETQKKQKEELTDDLFDKENLSQESVYCGGLYKDHGPILSSLSEDTMHSDSVRGERFLDDHFNENEIDPRNRWKASNKDIEEREEQKWSFRSESTQNEEQPLGTIPSMDASATVDTSARSFSDRLKLFQSKSTESSQKFKFESSKPKSSVPIGNLIDPKAMKTEEEAKKDLESTTVPDTSEIENLASDVKKCEDSVECNIDKPVEQVIDEEHQVSTSEVKSDETTYSHRLKRNVNSSRVERNSFKQQQTTTGIKPSYQPESCKDTHGKKSFALKSYRDNSKKFQSKAVDLSLTGTCKNQAIVKEADIDSSVSPKNNSVRPTLCLEEEKMDSMKEGKDSTSNSLQYASDLPGRSMRSYSTKRRSSSNSLESSASSLKDRDPDLRKSILNLSEKSRLGDSAPSSESTTTTSNELGTMPLESENKIESTRAVSDDSTANSSISSLTRDSNLPTSFAQQSASIFGVTLSKRRKNRIENAPEQKKNLRLNEKSIAVGGCANKPYDQEGMDGPQTIGAKRDVVEKQLQENEKQNIIGEAFRRRKISSSSISTCSVDRQVKNETSLLKQDEDPPIVEDSGSNQHIGSSRQPMKLNKDDRVKASEDETQLDAPAPKVEPVSLSRKVKTLSISDRLKMFERATVRNQIGSDKKSDDIQDTAPSDSPKSVETSRSPSSDDFSTSTKRRSTESWIKSVDDDVQSQIGQVETTPDKNDRSDDDDEDDNDDDKVGDRRKTLKSNRGTRDTSYLSQPKSYEVPIHVSDKSEVSSNNPKDSNFGDNVDDVNRLENRSKTLKSTHKEKKGAEYSENSLKEPSPPKTAYSARRKFFENLDRKRVQSSMSRPLVKETEPLPINVKSHREYVIDSHKDDTLLDSDGLPMLVTFEDNFLLQDNISTCLSASENRSVICKPDALLYSVSQKAIALMSAKAENKSTISFTKMRRDEDKEITRNNNLDKKRLLAQRLKLNREESSKTVTATRHSLRSRFAERKVMNSEEYPVDDARDEDDKDEKNSIEKQHTNKFRASDISQRTSRFERKKIMSEDCRESKYDEEAVVRSDIQDKNDVKCQSSNEDKEPTKKRTVPFHQSKYNHFARKEAESIGVNNDSQGIGDKPRPSMHSIEKTKNNKNCAVSSCRQFDSNRFVRKNSVLEKRNETESKDLREREEIPAVHVRNPVDAKSSKGLEEILDKQKIPPHNSVEVEPISKPIGSMSIRERRKFFESQCGKVGTAGKNKIEKEDSTVQNNSRKSSVSIAKSEDSEMTPLVGTNIVEQCEPLAHNIGSNSTYRRSDLQKRVSSVSTGTLDYSLTSSNSRSDLSYKRSSSASTNTHGPSSTPIYRRGFPSRR